ncbi:MAG: TraR/DksA family transcriptional regulator [Anaerolineae bacterium]|jgi:DnaK suppressor protein
MSQDARSIQDELEHIREHIDRLEKALANRPDYSLGEGDPEIVRWEMDKALLEQSREREANLVRALARMTQGTYGTCERCGAPIHPDRLAILPGAQVCIRCARSGVGME